jgi:hypothetical protein
LTVFLNVDIVSAIGDTFIARTGDDRLMLIKMMAIFM